MKKLIVLAALGLTLATSFSSCSNKYYSAKTSKMRFSK